MQRFEICLLSIVYWQFAKWAGVSSKSRHSLALGTVAPPVTDEAKRASGNVYVTHAAELRKASPQDTTPL